MGRVMHDLLAEEFGPRRRVLMMQRTSKANALDSGLVEALTRALDRAEVGETALLVLRSAHRAFSAGFDLQETAGQTEAEVVLRFVHIELMLQRLRHGPLASVALVEGAAYGAGADLALACTWRVGTPRAKFRFPGFRFGVALGTRHLASIVGAQKARHILLENRLLSAEEAFDCGLLTHLVQPEAVDVTVAALETAVGDLPSAATSRILSMTHARNDDADLADLVKSLIEPGLASRIARYMEKSRT